MNLRQEKLLTHIVGDYIKTARAVGSDYLVANYKLKVSGATVRNDCQVLEKEGYLTHPYTSAGRIPTDNGYRKYLESEELNKENKLINKNIEVLGQAYNSLKNIEPRDQIKNLAKSLAELVQGAILVGFNSQDVYYTGLSYLFSQPEFKDHNLVYNIGSVVDHLDEIFPEVYDEFDEEVIVKIGQENLFSPDCSFVGTCFNLGKDKSLIGILGPMRMDYIGNISRLKQVKQLLSG